MTQNKVGIGATSKLPMDYRIYNVGENILLRQYTKDINYYKISNRETIPFIEKQDNTNWLLAAGGEYNAGDISDWLEPDNDTLYILAMSILSDRNMELRLFNPSADQMFGIKSAPDTPITPEISPWKNPTVTVLHWKPSSIEHGKEFVTHFKVKNPSEYTNTLLKIGVTGFSYAIEVINKPSVFEMINLSIVRG